MLLRTRSCLALVGLSVLMTGCSEDFPARDEFISDARAEFSAQTLTALGDSKIGESAANTIINDQLGCVYDTVSADEALVDRYVSDPSSNATQSEIAAASAHCSDRALEAILAAMTESAP